MPLEFREVIQEQEKRDEGFKRESLKIPVVLCDEFGALVDGNGDSMSAQVEGNPLYVWCVAYNDSPPFPVLNNRKVPAVTGIPVFIGYRDTSFQQEMLEINTSVLQTLDEVELDHAHAEQHYPWGFDPLDIYRRAHVELKTSAHTTGLKVDVTALEYDDLVGERQVYPGVSGYSIAAHQPAVGLALVVLLYLDRITGLLLALAGATSPDVPTVTPVKPDTPQYGIASAYVRLDGAQTRITEDDIAEGRRFLSAGAGDVPVWIDLYAFETFS